MKEKTDVTRAENVRKRRVRAQVERHRTEDFRKDNWSLQAASRYNAQPDEAWR